MCCQGNVIPSLRPSQRQAWGWTSPVQGDGSEAEHSDRAEEPVQELDGLAEHWRVDPEAATRAGVQEHVERHAHQAGADAWAGQVLNEAPSDCLEDVGAAGAPQHDSISWARERDKVNDKMYWEVC